MLFLNRVCFFKLVHTAYDLTHRKFVSCYFGRVWTEKHIAADLHYLHEDRHKVFSSAVSHADTYICGKPRETVLRQTIGLYVVEISLNMLVGISGKGFFH